MNHPLTTLFHAARENSRLIFVLLSFVGLMSTVCVRGADGLQISEFMAANARTLADEDGEFSDWIEIHNAGTNTLNLEGWFLTDTASELTKWRFPNTNLVADGYLVVFASNKNRQTAGAKLHTNFRLSNTGEYLALVKPDGVTVVSEYKPQFPVQVTGVSYGIPLQQVVTPLISSNAPAKVLVPTSDSLGLGWTAPDFDDAAWLKATNGIGFETDPPAITPVVIANSVTEFSGTQGQSNWFYGYWNKRDDADGDYADAEFVPFPRQAGLHSASNFWTGTYWDWFAGNPPGTELSASGGHPAGSGGNPALDDHWVIRRYISEVSGFVRISGTLAHTNACGDGIIARIFVDGNQVFQQLVFATSIGYSVTVPVSTGSRIDLVIDAGAADNESCDGSTFTATIRTADAVTVVVADSVADWSVSGTQGEHNWFYGYYNRTLDLISGYQQGDFLAFPRDGGGHSAGNFWNGTTWDWFSGNPPWTEIGQIFSHPNGINNGAEHWTIRRWVSRVSGTVTLDWHLAKQNPNGSGVTGRVFHKGVQRDSVTIAGNDAAGVTRTLTLTNVQVGDFIDFTHDPTGQAGATDDGSDGSFMNTIIFGTANLTAQLRSNIEASLRNVNPTAYLRFPFVVTNRSGFRYLTMRMKYDDGFVAYLNGVAVLSRNAPTMPLWNSSATAPHPDAEAVQFEDYDLSRWLDLLQVGTNVLAIHGLNASAADSDFLILPELSATSFISGSGTPRYFAAPTPGAINGFGNTNLGPLLLDVAHAPDVPSDEEALIVTARVAATFDSVNTNSVTLYYRVMFSNEVSAPMLDDGLHGDGVAGDGIYGAFIPASLSAPGQMVRYYVTAADTTGDLGRWPLFESTLNSPKYLGTMVENPAVKSALPVLHWFVQTPTAADATSGTKASLFFNGEFYDNISVNRHGQSSGGFPKKSYDFDFNPGHNFRYAANEARVDDFNLLTTYPDKAHMRNMLAYETYRDAGSPYHFAIPVRVQQNGAFFSDAHLVENGDDNYLERLGLDPKGAFYKMYNSLESTSDAEKKTRKNESKADLQALINGCRLAGEARTQYLYDNVNIPEVINFLAARVITGDVDCCHKNYYVYRDTEGTGEWQAHPWDVDLSFGRVWSSQFTYWDDTMHITTPLFIGNGNMFFTALFNTPAIRQMYLRRVRTLMEQLLQTPGTPPEELRYEKRTDELAVLIGPDAALDFAKWPTWGNGADISTCCVQTLPVAVNILKTVYLPQRRNFLFNNQTVGNGGEIPATQPANAVINFGQIEFSPASGNQAQEFIELRNTNSYAVDMSGWKITGAVEYTFQAGMVLAANSAVYLSPDVVAFRARATSPRGGQGLLIQGNYQGQLSARGESLQLTDANGRVVAAHGYAGQASLPQQFLRITEIMYHPSPLAGNANSPENFEYLELKNIGPVALELTGVHFTSGIEFTFTGSAVTNLAPGQSLLLVKNLAAFTARYGAGFLIAGVYGGSLDNGGENLRLEDAVSEKILDFSYDNNWYPITDGHGFSLVIVNEHAPWNSWGEKESWRSSGSLGGSPGLIDPAPPGLAGILVNEVITHTSSPQVDTIELHNPTTNDVNIGGWFLSDDFDEPRKFRIPAGTMIAAGGFRLFDESQFNPDPGVPPSFAFSSKGDEVFLFSGDANTNLTGYVYGFEFGPAEEGVSFGRYLTSLSEEHFVAQRTNTFGATNAGPKVGPVVISEILYRPPDLRDKADNIEDEYVELYNNTAMAVPLFDPATPTNTWRLGNGVDFVFPTNVTMAAGSYLLVVAFDPAATPAALNEFRNKYGLSTNTPIIGPFDGKLDNAGESVELYKPGPSEAGEVPFILVEKIAYSDTAPWPTNADGTGASLQRIDATGYGNDAENWAAGLTPGAAYGGTLPAVTLQPQSRTVLEGSSVSFSVTASGSPPLIYQWRRNGVPFYYGANSDTLVLTNVQRSDAGKYSVVVLNPAGYAASSAAALTVQLLPLIASPPQNKVVAVGGTVTFNVTAYGTGPLRYQWRFNTNNIFGATNASLTFSNVLPAKAGNYSVVVTDDAGSVISQAAILRVPIAPVITLQPQSQTVFVGDTVTFTVRVLGTPPFGYRWRRGTTTVVQFGQGTTSLTITNVQLSQTNYSVIITNAANTSPGVLSSNAVLTVLTDSDGDRIPDDWEMANGSNRNDGNDASLDPDGDGMTNSQEYLAGTDPRDKQSVLRVTQMLIFGNDVRVGFRGVSGKKYRLERSENVEGDVWTAVIDCRVGTVLDMELIDANAASRPQHIYRVRLMP